MNKIVNKLFKKFKKIRKNKSSNLNIFIVCTAVIMVRRWLWWLLDLYIFPNCYQLSCLVCITIWIAILFLDDGKIDELE